jgi:hypothetical protein
MSGIFLDAERTARNQRGTGGRRPQKYLTSQRHTDVDLHAVYSGGLWQAMTAAGPRNIQDRSQQLTERSKFVGCRLQTRKIINLPRAPKERL